MLDGLHVHLATVLIGAAVVLRSCVHNCCRLQQQEQPQQSEQQQRREADVGRGGNGVFERLGGRTTASRPEQHRCLADPELLTLLCYGDSAECT